MARSPPDAPAYAIPFYPCTVLRLRKVYYTSQTLIGTLHCITSQTIHDIMKSSSGQCLGTFQGHSKGVRAVAVSPDGKYVYSGSGDNTVKKWDSLSGECLGTFQGHSDKVFSVAVSPDGKYVYSGSSDRTVKKWDSSSGQCLETFQGHSNLVNSVAVSSDGKYVYSGSYDKTVKRWDSSSDQCLATFQGHSNRVSSIALSPDGKYVYSGSDDKTINKWDSSSGQCLSTFKGHSKWVNSIAVSPDGKYVYSGSGDCINKWDSSTGQWLITLKAHSQNVYSVAISPDGKYVYSGSGDTTVRKWDISSRQRLSIFKGHFEHVMSIAVSADGKYFYSGSFDGTIKKWDSSSDINNAVSTPQAKTSKGKPSTKRKQTDEATVNIEDSPASQKKLKSLQRKSSTIDQQLGDFGTATSTKNVTSTKQKKNDGRLKWKPDLMDPNIDCETDYEAISRWFDVWRHTNPEILKQLGREKLRRGCTSRNIDWDELDTAENLARKLLEWKQRVEKAWLGEDEDDFDVFDGLSETELKDKNYSKHFMATFLSNHGIEVEDADKELPKKDDSFYKYHSQTNLWIRDASKWRQTSLDEAAKKKSTYPTQPQTGYQNEDQSRALSFVNIDTINAKDWTIKEITNQESEQPYTYEVPFTGPATYEIGVIELKRGTNQYDKFKTVLGVDSSAATKMVNTELRDQIRISYVGETHIAADRINDQHFSKNLTGKKRTGRNNLNGTIEAMRKEDDKMIVFVIRYVRWATKAIAKTVESELLDYYDYPWNVTQRGLKHITARRERDEKRFDIHQKKYLEVPLDFCDL